jgi:molecular chaperone DnaK
MGDRVDQATRDEIESAAAEVRKALDTENTDDIKAKTDALMQASHKLAEAIYQQAQQQAPPSGDDATGSGPAGDENVEEGDYEVIDDDQQK